MSKDITYISIHIQKRLGSNMKKVFIHAVFILAVLLPSLAFSLHVCKPVIPATTPTDDFQFYSDGTVRHLKTELVWQRCLVGQVFSDNGTPDNFTDDSCFGNGATFTWGEALQVADSYPGWRLPDINELISITEMQCFDPAINLKVFPDTSGDTKIWSGSPFLGPLDNYSRVLHSVNGISGTMEREYVLKWWVRLVKDMP
jgi:hypothetical protein